MADGHFGAPKGTHEDEYAGAAVHPGMDAFEEDGHREQEQHAQMAKTSQLEKRYAVLKDGTAVEIASELLVIVHEDGSQGIVARNEATAFIDERAAKARNLNRALHDRFAQK